MDETIDNIDEWNDRLNPPIWVNSDSDDSTEAEGADCGCCNMPKCCPPQLECQSITIGLDPQGFYGFESDPSADLWPIYKSQGNTGTRTGSITVTSDNLHDSGTHVSFQGNVSVTEFDGLEYERMYKGVVASNPDYSGSNSSGCKEWLPEDPPWVCRASGTSTRSSFAYRYYTPDGETEAVAIYGKTQEILEEISSVEGETTPDFMAWRETYPTDADYDLALDGYNDYVAAQAAWEAGYPVREDYSTDEDFYAAVDAYELTIPDYVAEPTNRPDEFFSPCWFKTTQTHTTYAHDAGYEAGTGDSVGTDKVEVTEYYWFKNSLSSARDNIYSPSSPDAVDTDTEGFQGPMTREEWIALAESVATGEIDLFPEEGCYRDVCSARRNITDFDVKYVETAFRYRWKLNKCCGLYSALSWLEVFYPQAFLDWMNSSMSDPEPPADLPIVSPKSWEWEGVSRPTECDNSNSADSIVGPGEPGYDAFDDDARWSPWSLAVKIPDGEEGSSLLRSLYMVCYRSDYGTKPDYIPLYGDYNPSDLNEDGTPDSQQ